jgi:hypothetical protein
MTVRQVVALLGWISVLAAGWLLFIGRVEPSQLTWWMLAMFATVAFVASILSVVDLSIESKP